MDLRADFGWNFWLIEFYPWSQVAGLWVGYVNKFVSLDFVGRI